VTRLSGGLATWARRLEFEPFRLRIVGTAGSGKTQLALRILDDAAAKGQRAQYVCFNRPLADPLARIAPAAVNLTTFHMLGDRQMRALGHPPDFRQPGVFEQLAQADIRKQPAPDELLDVLVIDEGQEISRNRGRMRCWPGSSRAARRGGSKIRCKTSTTNRASNCRDG
jgi:hypothetical protein